MMEFVRRRREDAERLEDEHLSSAATRSQDSKGRTVAEEPDEDRTPFERDRDRILHSKAFRRLKHKTQVFINPEGDHFVTRLTHTLQVTQIGRSIARYLSLNEPLTEAICLGHDVGHSPFGHTGEDALSAFVDGDWLHSAQGVRIYQLLEPLNLNWEVLDGIRAHTWKIEDPPATPEGWVCRFADRIAYLAHDVDDAIRGGVIGYADLPNLALETFGEPGTQWIGSMIRSVVDESMAVGEMAMAPEALAAMMDLREFMFERVYLRPDIEPQRRKAIGIVTNLVNYLMTNPSDIPDAYGRVEADTGMRVIDYVAGMSDRFALRTHDELFRPRLF